MTLFGKSYTLRPQKIHGKILPRSARVPEPNRRAGPTVKRHDFLPGFLQAGIVLLLSIGLLGAKELAPGEVLWRDGVAYRKEGQQLQEAGDLQRASAAYRKAVAVYPIYAEAYNDLGVVLESMGDLPHAEEAYKTALRLKPELAGAHSNLALLYEESGKIKEASEHWAARAHLGPPDDLWVIRARQSLQKYNLPVPEIPQDLTRKRLDDAQKAIRAGQAHMEAKRWPEAVQEFEKAVSLDPKDKSAARLLRVARSKISDAEARSQRELELSRVRVTKEAEAARREEAVRRAEAERLAEKARHEAALPPIIPASKAVAPKPTVTKVEVKAPLEPVPADALAVAREYAREKSKTRDKGVKELTQRAVAASREGQYRQAVDLYNQILILEPGNREAQQGLERAKKALAKQEAQAGAGY